MGKFGYYDYSWREPLDIDWAVIEDIGWNKKSEGTLSEKINPSKNVLEAHSDKVISGTLNFNDGNNIVILDGQANTYRGLTGDDTYFVSQLLPKNGKVSITDTEGANIIQISLMSDPLYKFLIKIKDIMMIMHFVRFKRWIS